MGFIIRPPEEADTLSAFLEQAESVKDITNAKLCPCGKMFTPYRSFQRYHSDECRVKYETKRPSRYVKKLFETKTCPVCGTEFKTNDGKKVYCSHECYLTHEDQRHVEAEERGCLMCGATFTTTHWAKRYCSAECRRAARQER